MQDSDLKSAEAAPDPTPVDQGNLPINNPTTVLDDSEKDAVTNTTTVEIANFFGASAPVQNVAQVSEEPVIEGFINTGVTIMVFNTALVSSTSMDPGVEIFPLTGQYVVTGEPLFNKLSILQEGAIRFLVGRGHWGKVFSHLPPDAHENLAIDIDPFIGEPMSCGNDPASFIGNLAQNNPNLKMIFLDNLLGNLPNWAVSKTKSALQHDFLALHNAGVNNHIALVAIMETNISDQNTFLKDLKGVSFCPPVFKVTGTRDANNVPSVNVSADGFSLDLHLDKGKWVEAMVTLTKSENDVLTVLKSRPAGAKKSDIMNATDMLRSEIDSAIKSLKDKSKIVSLRKGTYAVATNA